MRLAFIKDIFASKPQSNSETRVFQTGGSSRRSLALLWINSTLVSLTSSNPTQQLFSLASIELIRDACSNGDKGDIVADIARPGPPSVA
jgi:hypothetical protein